jgi:hypothetical protein
MATSALRATSTPASEKIAPSKNVAKEVQAALEAFSKLPAHEAPSERRLTKAEPEDEPHIEEEGYEDEEDEDEPRLEFPDAGKVWEFPLTTNEKKMRLTQLQDRSRNASELNARKFEKQYWKERRLREYLEELNQKMKEDAERDAQMCQETKRVAALLVHIVCQLSQRNGEPMVDEVQSLVASLKQSQLPGEGRLTAASPSDTGRAHTVPGQDAAGADEGPPTPPTIEVQAKELIEALDKADQRADTRPAPQAIQDRTIWSRGRNVLYELVTGWGGECNDEEY